jgi:hypothetical protein
MGRHWVWVAGVMAALAGGTARAEDVVLKGVEVRSGEECLAVLAEFNWLCREFERPEWIRVYEKPFWNVGGQLLFYRHDIDVDREDDAIISIDLPFPRCSRGAPLCEHFFLFGNKIDSEDVRTIETIMYGYPVLSTRGGTPGIYFDQSPQTFLTIEQIKDQILNGTAIEP